MVMRSIRRRRRDGFTLIEIIIAVAIVAIMAGAIAPLAFREFVRMREEETARELALIETGLLEFLEDTGRFPSEVEGLAALVADPGASGWSGPYFGAVESDPASEVTTDSFGNPYLYDHSPATQPPGAADLVVASGGADHTVTSGSVGGTWTVGGAGDDLLQLVAAGPITRDKIVAGRQEMELIAAACGRYYEDHLGFPAGSGDLSADYLDQGISGGAFIDPWNRPYVLNDDGNIPATLTVRSYGPDRSDDGGGGDDLVMTVSSIPPGRTATRWRLDIAQAALTANQSAPLTGSWTADRQTLGLTDFFEVDGWGRPFAVNTDVRAIFSVGPDGDPNQTEDNIPSGLGPAVAGGGGGG
ncbi:type II secretion system protein GspG, partial [bacterium]|nr:type II secretion system protein GspG [bacterium]